MVEPQVGAITGETKAGKHLAGEGAPQAASRGGVVARNAFHLLLGQVASTLLAIGFNAVLGRSLGAVEFGQFFLLLSMSNFAYVFVEWGQSAYLIREAAVRPAAEGRLLGGALAFRIAVALLAAAVTAGLAGLLGYPAWMCGLAALVVVCSLPLALSQAYGYLLRARNRMDLDAMVGLTAKALVVALALPALLLGGRLTTVILLQALGGLGALAVAVLLSRRVGMRAERPARQDLRELAVGGTSIAVFFVAISAQPYIDAIVLSKLTPPEVVGWYGAARNIMGVLLTPATILATASFPELSRAQHDPPALRTAVRQALKSLLGLGVLGAVGTYLFAEFAIGLVYGKGRFDQAASTLHFFAPTLLLFFIDILLGTVLTAVGMARKLAVVKILSIAVSTGLSLVLVPWFQAHHGNGGIGLVTAFGLSELTMLAAYLWLTPRGALDLGMLVDFGRAVAAGLATLWVFELLPRLSPWIALPACVVTFGLLAVVTGLITPSQLAGWKALLLRAKRGRAHDAA